MTEKNGTHEILASGFLLPDAHLLLTFKPPHLMRHPISLLRLLPCLAAALCVGESSAAAATPPAERLRWVRASSGELMHQIDVAEVLFFRADDKYTCVQTASAEHLIRTPIAELAAQLDPAQFVQVHRATIINLAHLAGTRRDEASRLFLRLRGHAAELPVSRAYVHLFKAM